MTRRFPTLLLLALFLVACGDDDPPEDGGVMDAAFSDGSADASGEDAGPPPPPPPAAAGGTLRFFGCDPEPGAVTVTLAAVEAARVEETGSVLEELTLAGEPPEAERVAAAVTATGEAGVLRYSAPDLPYGFFRVGVKVDDPTCGELSWRGPADGLVVPGDDEPTFDALAIRSRLEINAGTDADPHWVSAHWVDEGTTELPLRVDSDVAGVLAYDIQLSFDRFAIDELSDGAFCNPPEGSPPPVRIESPPGGREIAFDVTGLLTEPGTEAPEEEVLRYQRLLRGAPVYLRAVPVGSGGPLCGLHEVGASSWVRLVFRPPLEVEPVAVDTPPYRVVGAYEPGWNPIAEIISRDYRCYRVIGDHQLPGDGIFDGIADPMAKMLVLKGWYAPESTVPAGDRFCFGPPQGDDDGWLDDLTDGFSDLVGDIVDAVEWAVDRAAALYEEIKSAVVDFVANAVADLTGCEDPCRAALELGMEIALTSMGMPPSLPDFDQLMDQGLDYVAAELAAQAGVPDFVAEQALELAVEMAERAKATRGLPGARWLVRDTGGRSSLFTLEVSRNPSGASTTSAALWFRPVSTDQVWMPRYIATHVPAVGEPPLRVPVVTQPVLDGLPEVPPLIPGTSLFPAYYGSPQRVEAWYQVEWGKRLGSHFCARFEFWRAISVEIPVPIEPVSIVNISQDAAYDGFADPFEDQCSL